MSIKLRLLPLVLFLIHTAIEAQTLEFIEVNERDLIPEGITYDDLNSRFFVGSIFKHKIISISREGSVSDFIASRQDSIGSVLGMKVDKFRRRLFAISNTSEGNENQPMVHVYSLNGELLRLLKGPIGSGVFFNDLVLTPSGDAYVTDTNGGAIFYIDVDLSRLILFINAKELADANGIEYLSQSNSIVVSTRYGLVSIAIKDKELRLIPFDPYSIQGIDGLSLYKNSLIGIQNVTYPFTITQYTLSDRQDDIIKARLLATDIPWFEVPTTGTIVDNQYYFIANSQLDNYEEGKIINPTMLKPLRIGRITLDH